MSLRSKNGEALLIANYFNGGGHLNAGSFLMKKSRLSEFKVEERGIRKRIKDYFNFWIIIEKVNNYWK